MDVHSSAGLVDQINDWFIIFRVEIVEVIRAVEGWDDMLLS